MTPTHHYNPPRNAKRKAESPPPTEELASSRPQRKKRKQSINARENRSPSNSPVTTSKPSGNSALTKHLLTLYRDVENAIDETYPLPEDVIDCSGRLIATAFMKLPPKKRYPDYYVTIKKPIALDLILERIEKEEYDDTDALKADLTLMTTNAKKYNVKGSGIYEDAVEIQVSSLHDISTDFSALLKNSPPKSLRL